ncbi:serine/threonine-protein kinase pdik1l-A-like isoform X2 [Haliotis rubra]|uniref:serine/threonine-protein kinase pdik1l-A-like isoform X1 n=1 Tax=Haliotis rubra TaxID=36100 RepID=UPI001EE5E39D|nr:serine/threonine-protein kinase pdik1l-A-like isoform X1 [Haliotis rubra]XP_046560996.1 serine/threonine-protein kinase pdik1l-A-like isoform X2 [Haliotis rubra]
MGQSLSTGELLDKYDLEETLGEGSFGVVYRAINRETNEFVAVKEIKSDLTQREKFVKETELLRESGGHGNIVSIIESFEFEPDGFYIVLEYCELGDLNRYVTKTHVSVDSKVLFMYDMSNGLDFLHQINIVHRDMKPANVLVTESQIHGRPVCKISDLGEARMHASDMTSDTLPSYLTSTHGTMAYIAPEVLLGHYTKSCDVFLLGVIFYALFSDYEYLNPFVDGQCMYEVAFSRIQSALAGLQTLPTELRDLTLKMLKKDYHDRVECSTVKETLDTYINGLQNNNPRRDVGGGQWFEQPTDVRPRVRLFFRPRALCPSAMMGTDFLKTFL